MSRPPLPVPGPETAADPDAETEFAYCDDCEDEVVVLETGHCEMCQKQLRPPPPPSDDNRG